MRILLICHVEREFEWTFEPGYLDRLEKAIGEYDRVIHLTRDAPHPQLDGLVEIVPWLTVGVPPVDCERISVPSHNWHTDISRVFYDLYDHSVDIAGGFHLECLEMLRLALDHIALEYREREDLIYHYCSGKYRTMIDRLAKL